MASSLPHSTVTIILATVIPGVCVILLAAFIYYRVQRRKARFRNRGITPIDDEEIESWKIDRRHTAGNDEKPSHPSVHTESKRDQHGHHASSSVGSAKSPAVIVYQNRVSDEQPPFSPVHGKLSIDVPASPVLARAPNSRPGLTDETVRGDQAYVNIKRAPSARLSKTNPPRHARTKSSRSTRSSFGSNVRREQWYGHSSEQNSPRPSADTFTKSGPPSARRATISTPGSHDTLSSRDDFPLTGLSPRPAVLRAEIGRAIG
ncbi:hypothetical protein BBK36DRAFT_1188829 [Trichoderma citrinoviride]|uniref:Uncharacterized protein n=1 Tax=Trichoderma citrinoviride TaxID=58853 RepID=A0A2T4BKU3_9HYPO|nr:hypothetical protein BBK36DRAFT_1188829 [Trichoderma citrinoviride]PTB69890.1 hypothetical protein BBK36DRAFT_1188829 [Trichoderma citrinoviride]